VWLTAQRKTDADFLLALHDSVRKYAIEADRGNQESGCQQPVLKVCL
jgi:hypothetical protein